MTIELESFIETLAWERVTWSGSDKEAKVAVIIANDGTSEASRYAYRPGYHTVTQYVGRLPTRRSLSHDAHCWEQFPDLYMCHWRGDDIPF